MSNILVIDDEPSILTALELALEDSFNIYTSPTVPEGMSILKSKSIDLVLLDQYLGEYDGLDVLKSIKRDFPEVMVIAMTAHGTIDSSVKSIQMGAYYYITKPLDITGLKILIKKALDYRSLSYEVESLKQKIEAPDQAFKIVAASKKMDEVFTMIEKIKDLDINVLIAGESGTGKDLVAKGIHYSSKRSSSPIEIINCAAIPNNLLESELFGYERGAFTGAEHKYNGKIALANGGTLFLDEIGEMDISLQAKLLRVIQEKRVTPLGSEVSIPVDFRLIAATNRDLSELVELGSFREDLFFRLNVVSIEVPPLRERKEDIPLLSSFFIKKYGEKFKKHINGISSEAIVILENYDYPGNVRELENIVERAVALSSSDIITVSDLPSRILEGLDLKKSNDWIPVPLGKALDEVVKEYILATYEHCGQNKRNTAKMLSISERNLYNKLNEYGFNSLK